MQLQKGDDMIREADRLMAEAIGIVAGLYEDGILPEPKGYASAFHALWYGWSEMQRDLTEIKEEAARLRKEHAPKKVAAAPKPAAPTRP